MGGVLVLIGIGVSTLLWFDWSNRFVWVVMLVTFGFGAIGWVDDWRKVVNKDPEGMRSREKFFWQTLIGLVAALYLAFSVSETSNLRVLELFLRWVQQRLLQRPAAARRPDGALLQDHQLPAGRVRLHPADLLRHRRRQQRGELHRRAGRPGHHAGGPGRLGAGHLRLHHGQLGVQQVPAVPHIPGAGELLIFCAAMAGAGLAFLWFNANPAQVFMGDVGALALGGALGTIAVITRQEIVLAIMGGIFVAEALSRDGPGGLVQVHQEASTAKGRRILLMAPLHHHFEKKGWTETQVVVRFWIITMLLCLVGLASLKLR
jgi:phospho-N-acetylmuramoyl-pentapeptide-transferase